MNDYLSATIRNVVINSVLSNIRADINGRRDGKSKIVSKTICDIERRPGDNILYRPTLRITLDLTRRERPDGSIAG